MILINALLRHIALYCLMTVVIAACLLVGTHGRTSAAEARKSCRIEKQCRWVNFKQVCYYVKVCR